MYFVQMVELVGKITINYIIFNEESAIFVTINCCDMSNEYEYVI